MTQIRYVCVTTFLPYNRLLLHRRRLSQGDYTRWESSFRLNLNLEFPTTGTLTKPLTKYASESFAKVIINEKLNLCNSSEYKLIMDEKPFEVHAVTNRSIYSGAIKSNVRLNFRGEANTEYRTMSCSEIIKSLAQTNAEARLKVLFTEISVSILTNLMHKGMLTNEYWANKI